MKISGSIVLYKNSRSEIKDVIRSFFKANYNAVLYLIDNSPTNHLEVLKNERLNQIKYIKTKENIGYGRGHNIAFYEAIENESNYHIVLNPDIYFGEKVIGKIIEKMEKNQGIGLIMPKIKFPNGEDQNLCKLLPTPFNLIQRKFFSGILFSRKKNDEFEMKFADKGKSFIEAPYLSGCFMCLRMEVIKKIGGFDEKIFMYSEDLDLSRRIHNHYKTGMLTEVTVYHKWNRESYRSKKLLWEQIKSTIYYYNKYGWIFDKERSKINQTIINKNKR